jgi:subtilisin-like proprotein convertase family protein
MRAVATVLCGLTLIASFILVPVQSALAFDVCDDCEDDEGSFSCGSAIQCMGKMPGFLATDSSGNIIGRCKDLGKAECLDEPGEVCCGLEFIKTRWSEKRSVEPPSEIPDGDPGGTSDYMFVPESHPIDSMYVALEIYHEHISDLLVTLSHNGLTVGLVVNPMCEVALDPSIPLFLGDEGVGPLHCPPPECEDYFPGGTVMENAPYYPLEPLAVFAGQDMVGEWVLTVVDATPGPRVPGQLHGWELIFTEPVPTSVEELDETVSWGVIKGIYRP